MSNGPESCSVSEVAERLLASAYRDGRDSALRGERLPDLWELIDLGYSPTEAVVFGRAHREASR
jgi:hypothetical protein